jgi:DNA polymerase III sliding clamp (beta) subunit (PCNA family)
MAIKEIKNYVQIIVNTKELLKTLKHLKVTVKGKSKKALSTMCEITVTNGNILCSVPGSYFNLKTKTEGVAKFVVPFLYFFNLIKSMREKELIIKVFEGEINIGTTYFTAATCFIKDDRILRTINLPINYNDMFLLRLPYEDYTQEELDFNKMTPLINEARKRMKTKIEKAHNNLFGYEITIEKFTDFVLKEIRNKYKL